MAALSNHFAERRGFALSVHGIGGNVGDIIGPALTGLSVGVLAWRSIISVYAVLPLFLTFLIFWAFRDIGRYDGSQQRTSATPTLRDQLAYTKQMFKNALL
jgi:MFS family permease